MAAHYTLGEYSVHFPWLELGHGNITFSEELDFDPEELDIVYADNDTEASQ
jgi:hypothetical protein